MFKISDENKTILIKRSKSFAWRTGGMLLAGLLDFVLANIGLLDLPMEVTVILGLVIGEVTKYLNAPKAN